MLVYECLMIMLMLCKSSYARLTPEVLQQGPVTTDRTRPVTLNPYWYLTILDRTLNPQGPVSTDRTCPVVEFLLWNLTGVDRTLVLSVRSRQT